MDVLDLVERLLPKAAKWHSIGLVLHLTSDELDTIEADSSGVEECLKKVLYKWHDRNPHPTREDIIKALRSPLVADFALAKKLEDTMEYPVGKKQLL